MNATLQDYMTNEKGYLIPLDKVKPVDKLRDETVKQIIDIGHELNLAMTAAKAHIFKLFTDFVDLSAQEYSVELGGKKGNTTLYSFDGRLKVQIAVSDHIRFDERLQVAKQLIDECIADWSTGSNDNIKVLINNAFQVDKEGKISTTRVLGLRRLDINDDKWLNAMQAIGDSIQITDTKEYIRLYRRNAEGQYQQIPLDFANV